MITAGTSQSSNGFSRGNRFARTNSLSPAAATWARSSPATKRMTRNSCRLAYSALAVLSSGNAGSRWWENLDARAEPNCGHRPKAFTSIRSLYLLLASAYCARPLAVAPRLGPTVDGVRWPDSRM